jgi:5'-nucleotidase
MANPGGIRIGVTEKDGGTVSYGDLFASQPFRNQLVTMTLTGAQLRQILEQQWHDPKLPRILQVSNGFSYTWDNARPYGERIIASSMSLNGTKIDPARSYRVTANNYLSAGGDSFTAFKGGTAEQVGVYDVDALYDYFKANSPIAASAGNRIARIN